MNGINTEKLVVPLTVVGSVILGTLYISNTLNSKFNEVANQQKEQGYKMEKIEVRMSTMENIRTTNLWTNVDMFKWAVHLQQTNPTIKVPEPKHEE